MALLGDIGGFTEVLYLIGFALTTSVVRYQFSRDLMSSTYQVQHYNDNQSEYYVSKRARTSANELNKYISAKLSKLKA